MSSSSTNLTRVDAVLTMEVLKKLYNHTSSLEEYLRNLPGCPDVVQERDKTGYKAFLKNTIVGIPSGIVALQQPISFQQLSEQIEVVLRVIKRLSNQKRNGKNVLLIGWQPTPRGMWTGKASSDTGHFLPGNTTGQLKTPYWKTLLRRIGDEVMMYLLCNLSVFVNAPPSCFIQLTGTPVYDLVSNFKTTSPEQSLQQTETTSKGDHTSQAADVKVAVTGTGKKRKRTGIDDLSDQPTKRICKDALKDKKAMEVGICVPLSQRQVKTQEPAKVPERQCQRPVLTQSAKVQKSQRQRLVITQQSANIQKNQATDKSKSKKTSRSQHDIVAQDTQSAPLLQQKLQIMQHTSPIEQEKHAVPNRKARKTSNYHHNAGSAFNRDHTSLWKHVEDKKFFAVGMCYSHGGREKLPKSHLMECLPVNSLGARQLTGSIFNINSINKEYKEKEGTNQTDGSKSPDVAAGLKEKTRVDQDDVEKAQSGKKKNRKRKPKLTPKRYLKAQKLLHVMITQHRKTGIYFLLKYHCPMETKDLKPAKEVKGQKHDSHPQNGSKLTVQYALKQQCTGTGDPVVYVRRPPITNDQERGSKGAILPSDADSSSPKQQSTLDLVAMATSSWRVYLFIRSVLDRVVPHRLWGSMHNRNIFFKFVKRFLNLGRYERLSLHQLVRDMQVKDCDWVILKMNSPRPPSDLLKRRQMVADLFGWLMENYVITLVKTMFYVTECSFSKNQLLFFRKPLWHKLEGSGAGKLQDAGIIKPITQSVAMDMMESEMSLGNSNLRFVPKKNGLRPIVNMGKSSIPSKKAMSINVLLQDLFDVLTYIKSKKPALFGSAILGTDSIYPHWRQFVHRYMQGCYSSQPLYFVKLDIEKCYESITHDKLFKIMNTLLMSQPGTKEFLTRRYATVTLQQGKLQRAFVRHVSVSQDVGSDFHRVLMGLAKENQPKNAIIVNQVSQHVSTPTNLLSRLKQHVKYDILKCGGQHYLRVSGISQGSAISSLLCSYFYAHMEKCCLTGIASDGLLLHLVDDFLLVTPHLDKAHRFLDVLLKGLPQYGCHANPVKTLINFSFDHKGTCLPTVPKGGLFPWCGLLFDISGLHVFNDYSRYHGIRIRYTLTMDTSDDGFLVMKNKLKKSLQAKDICIFVDPLINSTRVIIVNTYHMLLMLAFRFHAYYSNLSTTYKTGISTSCLMGLILHMSHHFYYLAYNKLSSHDALLPGNSFSLTKTSILWLCLKAYWTKLSKHKTQYRPLLKLINKHRIKIAELLEHETVVDLQSCCTPDIPYDFTQMM